ncbi:hypothetical protein RHECNPAF_470020 [Rhizobium etli CNPAF512]|nr:hypothetical protein RHECNPAF_470020 [Rhizobium etli CNPAF512]
MRSFTLSGLFGWMALPSRLAGTIVWGSILQVVRNRGSGGTDDECRHKQGGRLARGRAAATRAYSFQPRVPPSRTGAKVS